MKDDRKWTVYIHTNKVNQKKYVGITSTSVIERWHHGHGYLTKKERWKFLLASYGLCSIKIWMGRFFS